MTGALCLPDVVSGAPACKSSFKLRSSASMSNNLNRPAMRTIVLVVVIVACYACAFAQRPTPLPTPNPATLPPGTQTQSPTVPPGTIVNPQTQPTPITPEPRQPVFPSTQAQSVPPLPDLTRLGIVSNNVLTLSINDAIKRALQNNNDIEVSRDNVRIGEQGLR